MQAGYACTLHVCDAAACYIFACVLHVVLNSRMLVSSMQSMQHPGMEQQPKAVLLVAGAVMADAGNYTGTTFHIYCNCLSSIRTCTFAFHPMIPSI